MKGYETARASPCSSTAFRQDHVWSYDGRRLCTEDHRLLPHFGQFCQPRSITLEVAQEVKRIEPKALAAGWTDKQLWNNVGWYPVLGLAALLAPGEKVINVTENVIECLKPTGATLRFRRQPDRR